jgi:hypothetical protein
VPQKFLPAVFAIRRDQCLVASLGSAGCRALLPQLLASIDTLVQAIDLYDELTCCVFGRQRHGKKETSKRAVDRRHADHHDMVSLGLP